MISKLQRASTTKGGIDTAPSLSAFLKVWLDHDLSIARMAGRSLAVFLIRIDDYHELASRWGGEALERVLAELTSRLKVTFRATDAIARSREDQFTMIQPMSGDPMALHSTAKTMLKRIQEPFCVGMDQHSLAASIGVAFYPEDGNSAERLLEHADEALRRTDRWGGNGFCVYSRSAARKIAHGLSRQEDLRHAFDTGDLSMRFQPVFDLATSRMTRVFGDGHWPRQQHQCLDMTAIARIAESAGLMPRFNEWLIDRVQQQLADWRNQGIGRPISLPVSRAQLLDGHLVRLLSTRLGSNDTVAGLLEISIDQNILLDQADHRAHTSLGHLTDLGIPLSLSNVGEGVLALHSLKKLPVRSIGLAPGLIEVIGRCSSSETMIEALIGFAHGLGFDVRAVGVSSQSQLVFLRDHGCDEATGAFLAPALKGADIDRLIDVVPFSAHQNKLKLVSKQLSMH